MRFDSYSIGLLAACVVGLSPVPLPAQHASADNDWQNLQSLVQPPAPVSNPAGAGLQMAATPSTAQQADRFTQASQAAKAFYTTYPNDVRAAAAKKLEAVTAVESVQFGGVQNRTAALAVGSAYRADPTNPGGDRYDVALAIGAIPLSLNGSLQGKRLIDNPAAFEALADKLYREFGDIDPIYHFYLGIVRTVGPADAAGLAQKIVGMNAPVWAKSEAQAVLARQALIGKPVPVTLTTVDGQALDLRTLVGQPTAIFVWSNRTGPDDLASLARVAAAIPSGTRLIYVSLQSDLAQVAEAKALAPLPGTFCFEQPGFAGLTAHLLGVCRTPCVYVLDRQGALAGFGRVEELPVLLAATTH